MATFSFRLTQFEDSVVSNKVKFPNTKFSYQNIHVLSSFVSVFFFNVYFDKIVHVCDDVVSCRERLW